MKLHYLFGLTALFFYASANACSCMDQHLPMAETFAKTDFIFSGKVIKKSRKWFSDYAVVEFQLNEVFKGEANKRAFIKTGVSDGGCGFPFKKGEAYLVFAYAFSPIENSTVPEYSTSICSLTKKLKLAEADLKALQEIKSTAP